MRTPHIGPINQRMVVTTFKHAKLVDGIYENENGELRHWINAGVRTGGYLIDKDKWLLPTLEKTK